MTSDAPFFSAALPNDGLMDLILINGDIHRTTAIGLQLSLESGKFFDNPHVSYRKISAFRVTPHNLPGQGNISIDGERLAFQPFQAEVHRGLGLTLSKNNRLFDGDGPTGWEDA
jgi:sphingosine kinase